MLQDKSILISKLNHHFSKKTNDTQYRAEFALYMEDTFDVPSGMVIDLMNKRFRLEDQTKEMLFWLAATYDHLQPNKPSLVQEFFSADEQQYGFHSTMEKNEVTLPIRLKMFQVGSDSWIGSISTRLLVDFQLAGLINYNESTQRLLGRVFKEKEEIYSLRLNNESVVQIQDSLHRRSFIPNTITLNMIPDTTEWEYDANKYELIIKKLACFDIIDGFHRLTAIMRETNANPQFVYPMELRIVSFEEQKARLFIYQEDRKNPMQKTVSETFNSVNPANRVIERVNEDMNCAYAGCIGMEQDKLIKSNQLLPIITYLWFKDKRKTDNRMILEASNEVVSYLNAFTSTYPEYLSRGLSYRELCAILGVYYYVNHEHLKIQNVNETIVKVIEEIKDMPSAYFSTRYGSCKTKTFKVIKSIIEE